MLINSATRFRIDNKRLKQEEHMSPISKTKLPSLDVESKFNNQDIKRPLKINHSDLSFKGLSLLHKPLETVYSKKEFFAFADKYLGNMGRELFADITEHHTGLTRRLIQVDGDDIRISKKTIPHLAYDGIIYPFKILPGDMLNGLIECLGHIPGLKKWSQNILEKPLFKNIRQRSKIDSKVNSLMGMIRFRDMKLEETYARYAKEHGIKVSEITDEVKAQLAKDLEESLDSKILQAQLKQFDPKSGNYDTKHERALNRLVSGLPPAIFLANDAYNLSRMMDDDSKAADKERKTRFRQEASRIFTSGYLTLITMGAFQNFINKSKAGIVVITGLTVLVTEMFSRLSNGKHIKKLTPEEARKENEMMHAPEAKIKPIKAPVTSTGSQKTTAPKEQQKPLLSFDTLMKGSAIVLGTGYGIKGFKHLPAIQKAALNYFENMKINNLEKFDSLGIKELNLKNAVDYFESKVIFKPFTDLYKRLTTQKFIVDSKKFDEVVKILNDYDPVIGAKYAKIGESAKKTVDGKTIIDFGSKDKAIKPLVNFIIAPFKFMWNTITLPYWMINEKLMNVFRKAKPKSPSKDIDAVARSFDRIAKQAEKLAKNAITKEQFEDFIQINMIKGFNQDSLSSVSNAELSNLAKTAASIATIWFLMTDNYNMVMLKSNGNDKEGANTKFKERFVQEGSRLFYQTLLIDLFNSTFRNQYNSSLMGMSWVTLVDTTLGEMLTRSSVGTPIKTHTRDELIDIETKQNNSTGFKKKYYNFMQRLTGKRSIKSYEVASKNNQQQNLASTQPPMKITMEQLTKD